MSLIKPGDTMANIQIAVEDEDLATIGRRLLGDPAADIDAATNAVTALLGVAAKEYVDWILGRERYRSLSELQIERVAATFAAITPEEAPTSIRLYNDYGLSHGQATYVARVLADRQLAAWRERALEDLRAEVAGKLEQAKANVEGDRGEAEIQLTLRSLAIRELERVFQAAYVHDPLLAPWRRGTRVGDLHFVGVASDTILALAGQLDPND